jgi:hypothetical protein
MSRGNNIYPDKLCLCLRLILLIVLGFNVIFFQGCNDKTVDTSLSLGDSIIWVEQDNLFITNDVPRAQAEIPFPLRLPTFFPSDKNVSLPQIQGPLAQKRKGAEIDVSIKYALQPGWGGILIREYNHPRLPPDPEDQPEYKYIEIKGKEVVTTKGNFSGGEGLVYYFNIDGIYFVVTIDNLPPEDTVRIVESIITQ